MRFYRTKEFKAIYAALESLLCSSSTGGSNGLPVPPLLEIVAEYAIDMRVTTWFGSSEGFYFLTGIAVISLQPLTFLVSDFDKDVIHYLSAEKTATRIGIAQAPWTAQLGALSVALAGFSSPRNVLVDMNNLNRIFVADDYSIKTVENGVVSTLVDWSTVQLYWPRGMALTSNRESLIVCDSGNNLIRSVNLSTRQTRSLVGNQTNVQCDGRGLSAALDYPMHCVWNRVTAKPHTELFITTNATIRRLDVLTNDLTTLKTSTSLIPFGIDQTPSGMLIVSSSKGCIYSVDPLNGVVVRLAGSSCGENGWNDDGDPLTEARFSILRGVAVVDSECCVAVTAKNCIRKVPLPPQFFPI